MLRRFVQKNKIDIFFSRQGRPWGAPVLCFCAVPSGLSRCALFSSRPGCGLSVSVVSDRVSVPLLPGCRAVCSIHTLSTKSLRFPQAISPFFSHFLCKINIRAAKPQKIRKITAKNLLLCAFCSIIEKILFKVG
ncbi:MAG: hypothetical protein HDT27_05365 [Subdoligranulum sp.]|nr:hypothetical protein [Subdoligranulum sp.]